MSEATDLEGVQVDDIQGIDLVDDIQGIDLVEETSLVTESAGQSVTADEVEASEGRPSGAEPEGVKAEVVSSTEDVGAVQVAETTSPTMPEKLGDSEDSGQEKLMMTSTEAAQLMASTISLGDIPLSEDPSPEVAGQEGSTSEESQQEKMLMTSTEAAQLMASTISISEIPLTEATSPEESGTGEAENTANAEEEASSTEVEGLNSLETAEEKASLTEVEDLNTLETAEDTKKPPKIIQEYRPPAMPELTADQNADVIGDLLGGVDDDMSSSEGSADSDDELEVFQKLPARSSNAGKEKTVEQQDDWSTVPTNEAEVTSLALPEPSSGKRSTADVISEPSLVEIGSAAAKDREPDDEFDYAFDGAKRDTPSHIPVYVPEPTPSHLVTNVKHAKLNSLIEEGDEEEEEEEEEDNIALLEELPDAPEEEEDSAEAKAS
eukprot:gene6429-7706_t